MSNPIFSFKFSNNFVKELHEHMEGFSLVKEFALINLLNIEVLVYWNLHYYIHYTNDKRIVTSIAFEPYIFPEKEHKVEQSEK